MLKNKINSEIRNAKKELLQAMLDDDKVCEIRIKKKLIELYYRLAVYNMRNKNNTRKGKEINGNQRENQRCV